MDKLKKIKYPIKMHKEHSVSLLVKEMLNIITDHLLPVRLANMTKTDKPSWQICEAAGPYSPVQHSQGEF